MNGEYPFLKICHLGKCLPICLPSKANVQLQGFRQLTIRGQQERALEKLLSICHLLVSLDFFCHDSVPRSTLKNHYFQQQLKHLKMLGLRIYFTSW